MIALIVKDLTAFRALESSFPVDDAGLSIIDRIQGNYATPVCYAGGDKATAKMSAAFLLSADIKLAEALTIRDFVTANPDIAVLYTPEEIRGYRRQVVVDGVKQWTGEGEERQPVMEEVPRVEEAYKLYYSIYDNTPYEVTDELGTRTITPAKFHGQIAAYNDSHLL